MKKFRLILLSWVIVISLLFSGTAYAQVDEELQLPSPGITPDSPFYFADIWGKKIGLFLAFGAEAKARKALEYTEERLAEAQVMAAKDKSRAVGVATNGYDEYVAIVIEKTEEARVKGVDISDISEITALATSNHLLVWDGVEDIVPEEAKEAIARARGVSINGQGNALRLLAGENPERAIGINLKAAEARLNRAKAKAEEGETAEVEEALAAFGEMNKFGEEISQIAQGLGKDTTTVEQLVAKATSIHLEVLAEVYGKVPEQAREAIERAMRVSVRGHERAVEALQKRGALGDLSQEPPIPEGIPDAVKEKLKLGVLENDEEEGEAPGPGRGRR